MMININTSFFVLLLSLLSFVSCNDENKINKKESVQSDSLRTEDLDKQILYHGDCSYSLTKLKNWDAFSDSTLIADGTSRILVVYRPSSAINTNAPLGIYSNVIFKELLKDSSLEKYMENEKIIAVEREEIVSDCPNIIIPGNKKALVRKYINNYHEEYFAVAYINEPNHIIMINYTAKDSIDFKTNYKEFEELVKTYEKLNFNIQ